MTLAAMLSDTDVCAYETELAGRLGVGHVVAVSSGTAALQCALDAVGVGRGDEVLVPAVSPVMSAAPACQLGATPVIVDCLPSGDLDLDDAAAKITDRTKALLPVYLWGRACDETKYRAFADARNLALVVDACQALGTQISAADSSPSRQAGSGADLACFSTHRFKLLSTDEGGFLTTDNPNLAARARAYRTHWQVGAGDAPPLSRVGHNFRLAGPLAAIGRHELAQLDHLLARRFELTSLLVDLLRDVPQLTPLPTPVGVRWNHYAPVLRMLVDRPRALAERLAGLGVPNSTGTFALVPQDQRSLFSADTPPCPVASWFLDGILAVVLTRDDDEGTIRDYAATITQEVTEWASV